METNPIDMNDLDLADEELDIDPNAAAFAVTHMPFGKYRGWRMPDRCLFRIATNLDLDGALKEANRQ